MRLNSFHFQLSIQIIGLLLLVFSISAFYFDKVAEKIITSSSGKTLQGITDAAALIISSNLSERFREITLISKSVVLVENQLDSKVISTKITDIKQSYPYYTWIGLADTSGKIVNSSNREFINIDVSDKSWYVEGLINANIGRVQSGNFALDEKRELNEYTNSFLDMAAPVFSEDKQLKGVLVSHIKWNWITDLLNKIVINNNETAGLEFFILGEDGQWIYPSLCIEHAPEKLPESGSVGVSSWQSPGQVEHDYLTVVIDIPSVSGNSLRWRLILRQPLRDALGSIKDLHFHLFVISVVSIFSGLLLTFLLARRFSKPIKKLSKSAKNFSSGAIANFKIRSRVAELNDLSQSLEDMMLKLSAQKDALEITNHNLENVVSQRTVQLEEANRILYELSRTDQLTGISNRRVADETLDKACELYNRYASPFSILILDIDHFKKINDNFGHDIGDDVLKSVAGCLSVQLRSVDILCRFGGEEFIIIANSADKASGYLLAEKLRLSIKNLLVAGDIELTVSIGVASVNAQCNTPERIIKAADSALYEAKRSGRNQVKEYSVLPEYGVHI